MATHRAGPAAKSDNLVGLVPAAVPRPPLRLRDGKSLQSHLARRIRHGDLHELDVTCLYTLLAGTQQSPYTMLPTNAPLDKATAGTQIPTSPRNFRALRRAGALTVDRLIYCLVNFCRNFPNHKAHKTGMSAEERGRLRLTLVGTCLLPSPEERGAALRLVQDGMAAAARTAFALGVLRRVPGGAAVDEDLLGALADLLVRGGCSGDRDVVLAAVGKTWVVLQHAAPALQADRGVVLAAVKQNGLALQLAAPALQADRGVVLAAVAQNGRALEFAAPALRADRGQGWPRLWCVFFSCLDYVLENRGPCI